VKTDDISRRSLLTLGGSALAVLGAVSCKREALDCNAGTLGADALSTRQALGYVDVSADPQKTCEQCQQYLPAAQQCGECKVLKGPINPRGTCRAFALR
jgi:hypothetical protein